MQQAAPRKPQHEDTGVHHAAKGLRIICTEQEAEPGNKEDDQRFCPICLPPPSSCFHSLGDTQPEAAEGNPTTPETVCAIQNVDAAWQQHGHRYPPGIPAEV